MMSFPCYFFWFIPHNYFTTFFATLLLFIIFDLFLTDNLAGFRLPPFQFSIAFESLVMVNCVAFSFS